MKITKGNFLKLINEGFSVDEIIDKNLSLIDGAESSSGEEVSNKSTSKTHADAVSQGLTRTNGSGYFLEANSALQGKTYQFNDDVMEFLKTKVGGEGDKRIQGILDDGGIMSYELIKRFKHDIESEYSGDWGVVLNFINTVLNSDRKAIEIGKEVTSDTGMENRFRDEHEKDGIIPNADNEKQVNF